jgi:hypothetical protein
MAEPTIICPKCKNEIKLTESLAAPLIESTRRDFEQRLAQKDLDVAGREKAIQDREAALSKAKDSLEGQQTKTELVYQYLTGPRFRQRVQAIVEAFSSMKEDLDKERKVILKQWAKREEQIERVMQSTVGMYGDLQGIAGSTIQEIEGLEFKALGESAHADLKLDGK